MGRLKNFRAPRMWDWLLITLGLMLLLAVIAPQQLPVVAYKAGLVALAVAMSYWIDHSLLKDAGTMADQEGATPIGWRMLARALIFIGCVLGMTLGL